MVNARANLDVETLLKIVLGLIAVLLVLEIFSLFVGILRMLTPVLLLAAALLIVLWLLDRV